MKSGGRASAVARDAKGEVHPGAERPREDARRYSLLLAGTLASRGTGVMTEPDARDRFLHIADLHFWRVEWNPLVLMNKRLLGNANVLLKRRHHFHQQHAGERLAYIAGLGIPDAILTGDFTSTATPAEFELAQGFVEELRRNRLDLSLMPGNHDVYTFESVRRKRYEEYLGNSRPRAGAPLVRRLPGGTPVVMVDTVQANYLSSRGHFPAETEAPLEAMLASLADPLVVAAHYPVLPETYAYRVTPNRALERAEALRRILGESGKRILYIHGHEHRCSFVQDPEYPQLQHLSTDCLFRHDPERETEGEISEIGVHAGGFFVYRHRYWGHWVRESLLPR